MRAVFFLLGVLSITSASADVLILDNGDRISGELQSMSEGELTWKSDKFGDIVVKQSSVSLIETRGPYQISVGRDPAYSNCLLSIQGEMQTMLCDEQAVNIPDWRLVSVIATMQLLERDTAELTGETVISLKETSGNSELQGYELDTEIQVRTDLIRHRLRTEYDNQKTDDIKTQDQTKVDYGFDWFFTDNWFFNANGNFERNKFNDAQERQGAGIGAGLQAIDSNIMALSVEVGVSHIYERFETVENQEFESLRWKLDYNWQVGGNGAEFFHRHTLFQSFDAGDDWEWDSDTGFSLPINGRLKSILKFEYDYRNIHAVQDKPFDKVWSFGIGYDW